MIDRVFARWPVAPQPLLAVAVVGLLIVGSGPICAEELKPWSGGPTPELRLKDLKGAEHDLAAYRGTVVLVNFWATWCEPCRDEMPSLQRLSEQFAGRNFAVLAVDMGESAARISEFLRKTPVTLRIVLDRDSHVTKAWKVRILPASFVVGRDGRIHYSATGDLDWTDAGVMRKLSALLGAD
jgi:thiol-disulfide isomerase/thioredoxin